MEDIFAKSPASGNCIKLSAIILSLLFTSLAYSQEWDGDNSVGQFINNDNWYGNTQPTWSSGSDLIFQYHNNAAQTSMYINYGTWKQVRSIIYASTFSPGKIPYPFDSDGNGFDIFWKIENYCSAAQQIRMPLSIKGSAFELNPINGDLMLDNDRIIYNTNNRNYEVYGNNGHHLILGNQPEGDNNSQIIIHENSIVEISNAMGSNCFGGGVKIEAGELWFNAGSSINGGSITVGNGNSNTAKVFLNDPDGGLVIDNNISIPAGSGDSHIGGLNSTGTNTYSGTITFNAPAFLECWGGGVVNFTGDITGNQNVTIQPVSGANATIQYSGADKSYVGTTTIKKDANLKISSNQTLGNLSLEAEGKLIVDAGQTLTITGAWTGGGTIENNGTIILNGPSAFPGTGTTISQMNILNLNKIGTTDLDAGMTINGGLVISSGIFSIGDNDLTFDVSATVSGSFSSQNMIQADGAGTVIKEFSSTGSFTFPIGDVVSAADFSPATITMISLSGTPSIGMNVTDAKHPNNVSPNNFISRYWSVSASGGSYTANATFNYMVSDGMGAESSMVSAGYATLGWITYSLVNTTNHQLVVNGVADLNKAFTGGDQFSTSSADYFRSNKSGNWNDAGNWDSSPNGINNWATATLSPTSESQGITILAPHTININSAISLDQTILEGTLQLSDGGVMNINDGTGNDLNVLNGGTLLITSSSAYSTSIKPVLSASLNVATGGIVAIGNGSPTGTGYESFATSTANNWENNSKFIWNNGLAFNASNLTFFSNADENTIPIFEINTSPAGSVGGGTATTINGLFVVNEDITFSGGGNKIFRNGICGNAVITQDGSINNPGNFQITGNNAILGGSNLTLNLTDILNLNSNVEVPTDSVVTINKNNGNATSGSISKGAGVVFTVNGTVDMTIINMNNTSGSVDINGFLKTASTDGLTGSGTATISSGTINLNSGSTIEYYAAMNQKISTTSQLNNQKYYNLVLSGDNLKSPSNTNPIIIDDGGSLKITGQPTLIINATSNNIGPNNTSNTTSLIMENGRLKLGTLGFTGSGTMPSMKGTYNLSGGVIEFAGSGLTTQTIRSGDAYQYYNIEVSGTNVSTSGGNINLKDNGRFTVNPDGIFNINTNSIKGISTSGTAIVQVKSGGTFRSSNTGGFNGRSPAVIGDTTSSVHSNITNIILDIGSTVSYSRDNSMTGDGSQPITNANNLQYQNLILAGSGNKIAPSNTLVINGDFSKTTASVFVHNSGTVEFNSSLVQEYTSVAPYPVFYDLINHNTSSLNIRNPLSVKNSLELGNNSKIDLGGNITLISDATGTAYISKIPEGANAASIVYGTGAFVVERYIPNHSKAWQLLSVPTKGSTVFESWQNLGSNVQFKGVNITALFADYGTRGFDQQSAAPSMKYYDPLNDTYVGIERTSDPIALHDAYFLFVRGDRSMGYGQNPTEVTLHTTGTIYEPANAPAVVNVLANKWAMIGNPYASSINFNNLETSAELEKSYYIWDPRLTAKPSVYGLGAFRKIIVDEINGDLTAVPEDPLYADGEYPPIQSGQAFFVYNPSSSNDGTLKFTESAKVAGSYSVLRKGKGIIPSKIATNLFVNINEQKTLLDGTLLIFDENYSRNIDKYDSRKILNSGENISLSTSKYPLIVEKRPAPKESDTTFFSITGLNKRNYSLQLNSRGLSDQNLVAILNDNFTKTQEPLNEGINEYNFSVDDDKSSSNANRFFITYENVPSPFAFKNVNAIAKNECVHLTWKTISDGLVSHYNIESGVDSTQLAPIKNIASNSTAQYSWTHYPETDGTWFYRISANMKDGSIAYSKILQTEIDFPTPSITISPNPATGIIHLKFSRQLPGKYTISIFQSDGKIVITKSIEHDGNSKIYEIPLAAVSSGIYQVQIQSGKIVKTEKVFIE